MPKIWRNWVWCQGNHQFLWPVLSRCDTIVCCGVESDRHCAQVKEEKKKANPRISCLDQLGEMNLRRVVVPKLTLTEGTPTPKKFFKSSTPLILSTPTLKVIYQDSQI